MSVEAILAGLQATETALKPLPRADDTQVHIDAKAAFDAARAAQAAGGDSTAVAQAAANAAGSLTAQQLSSGFATALVAAPSPPLLAATTAITVLAARPGPRGVSVAAALSHAAAAADNAPALAVPLADDNAVGGSGSDDAGYTTIKSMTIISAATATISANATTLKTAALVTPSIFNDVSIALLILSILSCVTVILIASYLIYSPGPITPTDRKCNVAKMVIFTLVGVVNVLAASFDPSTAAATTK
jgi:hypothetical protein